jgi:hypothetical protein
MEIILMSKKQRRKHIDDSMPKVELVSEHSELDAAEPTPDGLGTWEGGRAALKGSPSWVSEKSHSTRTADAKNEPGTNSHLGPKPIKQLNQKDFSEIHVEPNGDVFLYNVDTDRWDIKGDSADIPYFEDERGWRWGYNVRTGKWDVPVEEQEYV